MDKPQIICHVEKSLNYTLFDCKWIPKTAKFIVVGSQPRGTGTIELFEICSTDVKSISKVWYNYKSMLLAIFTEFSLIARWYFLHRLRLEHP